MMSVLSWKKTVSITICGLILAGCNTVSPPQLSHINNKVKFSEKSYGVKASPRVTSSKMTKVGGGYYKVGSPYKVAGKWYHPKEDNSYDKVGIASWYGPNFHGRKTANNEVFNQFAFSAAHPTLPLPSYVRVTNVANGKSVIVRVNDRGPYAHGRLIDLSRKTAETLDVIKDGTAKVRVQYIGRALLESKDNFLHKTVIQNPSKDTLAYDRQFVANLHKPKQNFGESIFTGSILTTSDVTPTKKEGKVESNGFMNMPTPRPRPIIRKNTHKLDSKDILGGIVASLSPSEQYQNSWVTSYNSSQNTQDPFKVLSKQYNDKQDNSIKLNAGLFSKLMDAELVAARLQDYGVAKIIHHKSGGAFKFEVILSKISSLDHKDAAQAKLMMIKDAL